MSPPSGSDHMTWNIVLIRQPCTVRSCHEYSTVVRGVQWMMVDVRTALAPYFVSKICSQKPVLLAKVANKTGFCEQCIGYGTVVHWVQYGHRTTIRTTYNRTVPSIPSPPYQRTVPSVPPYRTKFSACKNRFVSNFCKQNVQFVGKILLTKWGAVRCVHPLRQCTLLLHPAPYPRTVPRHHLDVPVSPRTAPVTHPYRTYTLTLPSEHCSWERLILNPSWMSWNQVAYYFEIKCDPVPNSCEHLGTTSALCSINILKFYDFKVSKNVIKMITADLGLRIMMPMRAY